MSKYNDFSLASSALNTALLASIGDVNQNILRTTFPALKPYMPTSTQIVSQPAQSAPLVVVLMTPPYSQRP